MSLIGYHLYADAYENLDHPELARLLEHTRRNRPAWINVTADARPDVGMKFVQAARREYAGVNVIFRHLPGGDAPWTSLAVADWYRQYVEPLQGWLKEHTVYYLTDNESQNDDMRDYARWMASAVRLSASNDVRLAVGRFATGNPREMFYQNLDDMWTALAQHGGVWTPNEYFDTTPEASAGHLFRYIQGWKRCDILGIARPVTVIGEFGLAVGMNPHKGYTSIGMNGATYARMVVDKHDAWYRQNRVAVCVFSVGKWRGFEVDGDYFTELEAIESKRGTGPLSPPPVGIPTTPPDVIPLPPPATDTKPITVTLTISPDDLARVLALPAFRELLKSVQLAKAA